MRNARIVVLAVTAASMVFPRVGVAQGSNVLSIPDPAALPSAPFVQHLLLEQPGYVMAVLMVGAIVAYVALKARGQGRRGVMIAAGAVALAVSVYLISRVVETDRERVIANTADLVHATATGDAGRVEALIFDSVRLINVSEGEMDRGLILTRVREYFGSGGKYAIQEHAVLEVDAAKVGPNTSVAQVKVRVTPAGSGFPVLSWWKVNWQKEAGEWRVVSIEGLSANLPGIVR